MHRKGYFMRYSYTVSLALLCFAGAFLCTGHYVLAFVVIILLFFREGGR